MATADEPAAFDTVRPDAGVLGDVERWDFVGRHVVPHVLTAADGARQLRVWSSGCGTGEEPYSVALLLASAMGEHAYLERVRVFATDPDSSALVLARRAYYPLHHLAAVPPDLIRKYFVMDADGGAVARHLRRSVVFGRHRIVEDPPLSHVHLLLCRKTLVHLPRTKRDLVVGRLGFALEAGGILLLGEDDPLPGHVGLAALDAARRAFVKVARPL